MLSNETVEVLKQSTYSEFIAILPGGQLERDLYEEVNDVLVRCGGKWNRSKKGHVFPYDPEPLIKAVIDTGQMPPKNPTAFFPTPRKLVDLMADLINLEYYWQGTKVLEPSGGTGGILDVIREAQQANEVEWQIDTCECLDINRSVLQKKGYNLVGDDFMEYRPDFQYDVVMMNPPFSLDGAPLAYIDHCMHAWSMLRQGGKFAAIVPPGFIYRKDKKNQDFLRFVCDYLQWEECGDGAFKESGTGVNTLIVYGEKADTGWKRAPYNGWPSWAAWNAGLHLESDFEFYSQLSKVRNYEYFVQICMASQDRYLKTGTPIFLTTEDIQALWRYFREDMEFADQLTPVVIETKKPAIEQADDKDLGGLFAA